jgi:hypothetical protein
MSEIKVNKISPRSGTDITLGDSGDNFIIPSGATLTNNGTASGFASIAWQSTIVTGSTLTAVAGNGYWIDTTSNACTITLPGSASVGDQIIFSDYKRTWSTNAVTINTNSLNFQGYSSPNPVYNTNGQSVSIVYSGATQGWIPISDDDVTWETAQAASVEYLVVAGGGSGGKVNGAAGGAGGYLTNYGTSTITFNPGIVYTITVGGGAAAQTSSSSNGTNGSNSVLSGADISTVTAIGGGYGAYGQFVGAGGSGGSGGGGGTSGNRPGGTGTVGQGNDGGSGADVPPAYGSGGGGGAGAVGANGSSSAAGDGGDGLSNSITGSATYYAGGGGGAADSGNPSCGSGGLGGGGAGTTTGSPGVSGTANTGGGGGGTHVGTTSGAGGSGVVILRMLATNYSGNTTGSPTVADDGSYKVLTYTASGSYTQ